METKVKASAFIILFALLSEVTVFPAEDSRVQIEYFFQPGCPECEMVDSFIMPRLKEHFGGQYFIKKFDVNKLENIPRLVKYQEVFNITKDEPVSMVVNRSVFLNGYKEMENRIIDCVKNQLETKIKTLPESPGYVNPENDRAVLKHFDSFTFPAVFLAGFLDGINPCVFATLIFFISLLSVSKIKGGKLILAGSVYCFACFISYLALGFGIFRFLKLFSGYKLIQFGVNIAMLLILAVLALLSFRDAWNYKKTGKAESVDLQLPRKLKLAIHSVMRKGLHYRHLIPGAFFIGVLVTAIESVCTGQVYVPTLVLLSKEGHIRAMFYLLLYNMAFIFPLLIIFATSYKGVTAPQLIEWSKKNIVTSKILMGCFFIVMAVLILIL